MEMIQENLFLSSSEDIRNQQIHGRVCELVKTPSYLLSILEQHASHARADAATLEIVAEAVLSDNDQAVDRYLIDTIIEITWKLAEYELEAMEAGWHH